MILGSQHLIDGGLTPLPICPWGLQFGVASSPFYTTGPPFRKKNLVVWKITHSFEGGGWVY